MAVLIAEARDETGLEHLLLSAAVHNQAARALYQAVGFVGYGIESRAMKVGDRYVDEERIILIFTLNFFRVAGKRVSLRARVPCR